MSSDARKARVSVADAMQVKSGRWLIPFGLMDAEAGDFAARYVQLDEGELYVLARDYDALTEPAQSALRTEFARRKLDPPLIEEGGEAIVSRKLMTLRRYRDLSEAIVARSLLESAGIVVYLYDENLVRLDWQVSNFIGGIRLQVGEADAAAARELLDQPVPEIIEYAGPFDTSDQEFMQPHCPRCGSVEISFEGAGRGAALTGLFVIGLPLPPGRETWSCQHCGARWEDKDEVSGSGEL